MRKHHPRDRRIRIPEITETGEALRVEVAQACARVEEAALRQFGDVEVRTLRQMLFAGTVGWRLIVTHHRKAERSLQWLVPTLPTLSLTPDALLLINDSEPGTNPGRVGALMLMHFAIGLVSVPLYRKFLPPYHLTLTAYETVTLRNSVSSQKIRT